MKNDSRGFRYWFNLFFAAALLISLIIFLTLGRSSYQLAYAYLHPALTTSSGEQLKKNNISYEDIELTTTDGIKLAAWYTPPKNGAVILVAHAYTGSRVEDIYVMFAKQGYGVLAWDFRAHGESGGDMSTLGYFEQLDMEAALNFALALPDVEHVGAWGGSMGAATAILTAAKHPEIEAIVSDSAFPTLKDVMKLNVPVDFMQPFVFFFSEQLSGMDLDQVQPVDEIAKISPRPVFIIDGWDGPAVIMNSPYRLYDATQEPKQIWVENGVPHLEMYKYFPAEYEKRILGFFDSYFGE